MSEVQTACLEIFDALADWHVVAWTGGREHDNHWMGDCRVCRPVLAALRYLGWRCDRELAARLDAINELAGLLAREGVRHE